MNLRQLNHAASQGGVPSNYSALQFQVETRVIANMGQPLQVEDDDEDEPAGDEAMAASVADTADHSDRDIEQVSLYSVWAEV